MKMIRTVLMVFLALAVAGGAWAEEAKGPKYGTNVGDQIQPVKIKTMDGEAFDTANLGGKTMFVFVNSMCSLCAKEMNDLARNADKFEKIKVYLVSVDQNTERAMRVYEKYTKLFGLLHDPEYVFGAAAGLYSTPSTLILDKDGKILFKKAGYRPGAIDGILKAL